MDDASAGAATSQPEAEASPKKRGQDSVLICDGCFEFKRSAIIGRNGFSVVRRGRDVQRGRLVAIKCFSGEETARGDADDEWVEQLQEQYRDECLMLRRLHGGGAAEAEVDAPPAPVVRLLGFSSAGGRDPAPADDG